MRAIFSFFIDKWLHTYSILSLVESLKTIPKGILTFKPHIVKREKNNSFVLSKFNNRKKKY